MKIRGLLSNEREPKITSYYFNLNDVSILFDYGTPLRKEQIKNVDLIFISHSHLDHIYGLINDCLLLRNDTRIIATRTTKRIILGLLSHGVVKTDNVELKIMRLSKIEELLYDVEYDIFDLKIKLYQSGHTYGAAMILVSGDKKIFYTGDINYYPKSKMLSYMLDEEVICDYLIIDGTNIQRDDFKKQSLSHIKKNVATFNKKFFINARPEKCVMIATYLAREVTDDRKIYYEGDLDWFLDILVEEGYMPFDNLKILVDKTDIYKKEDGIYLSSVSFKEFNNDFNIGLHISMNDLVNLLAYFNSSVKILVGHFFYKKLKEIEEMDLGYYILKEGDNII